MATLDQILVEDFPSPHLDDDQSSDLNIWGEETINCLTRPEIAMNYDISEEAVARAIQREDLRYQLLSLKVDPVLWAIVLKATT